MNAILSQNKQHIVSAEAVEYISTDKGAIFAHTIGGTKILLGKYKTAEHAEQVMCFVSYEMTKTKGITIPLPPEDLFDRKPNAVVVEKVTISPEFKKMLEDMFGGEK